MIAPGNYVSTRDRWGTFANVSAELAPGALVVIDARVASLHPQLMRALRSRRPIAILSLRAGERTKSLAVLGRVLAAATPLRREGTLLSIGGGTLGDLCTVAAHLIKRGVTLIQVPTTVLAAADSSLGGKGALNLQVLGMPVKNAAGVFHYAKETWLCPELFDTLEASRRQEGEVEAWKMVVCLDAARWRRYRKHPPKLATLVRDARRLKSLVCKRDPYELTGHRSVLNFGHTFGHVLESVSRFRLPHGQAVGLGMVCALDVGRLLRVTPGAVAVQVERGLREGPGILDRSRMRELLSARGIETLLASDKKTGPNHETRMVLLREVGQTEIRVLPRKTLRHCVAAWSDGRIP